VFYVRALREGRRGSGWFWCHVGPRGQTARGGESGEALFKSSNRLESLASSNGMLTNTLPYYNHYTKATYQSNISIALSLACLLVWLSMHLFTYDIHFSHGSAQDFSPRVRHKGPEPVGEGIDPELYGKDEGEHHVELPS
jgi:hypothetical protein